MTPDELREAGEYLYGYGWQTRLSEILDINSSTVWRWAAGKTPISGPAIIAIRCLVALKRLLEEHKAPTCGSGPVATNH